MLVRELFQSNPTASFWVIMPAGNMMLLPSDSKKLLEDETLMLELFDRSIPAKDILDGSVLGCSRNPVNPNLIRIQIGGGEAHDR